MFDFFKWFDNMQHDIDRAKSFCSEGNTDAVQYFLGCAQGCARIIREEMAKDKCESTEIKEE